MVKINLETILYNNDKTTLNYIKSKKLIENIEDYEKPIEKKIVNQIDIEIRKDDTIDYMLKKLCSKLFSLLEKENNKKNKHCFYCFADRDLENKKDLNEIIKITNIISLKKIEKIEDIDNIDINDEELEELEIDEEEDELSELSDIDLSDIEQFGGSKDKNNIFICKNCKKVYFFNKYFNYKDSDLTKYNDIFPFPELFYLRNNQEKLSFKLIDNQRKTIEYKYNNNNIISPYNEIQNVNKTFFIKDKKNQLYKYLESYSLNNGKYYKYIVNHSFMLLNNFDYDNLTITYFPELSLYKKNNGYKLIDLYSQLYYPNVDFSNYYLKFTDQIKPESYVKGLLKNFEINKREINTDSSLYSVEQIVSEFYGENEEFEGWGIEIENQEQIQDNLDKLEIDKIKFQKYINKINYKFNDSYQNTSLINFSLLYQLFDLDEEVPFLTSYLAEEGVMLEKYYKPLQEEIKKINVSIKNKKIVRFLVKLPEKIVKNSYFYVNLYENLKMEVTIILKQENKKYITKEELLLINDNVNKLVKRLNKINIFTFNDVKIPLSDSNIDDWNKKNTNINSLNINFEIKNQNIENINKKIRELSKCFKNTFIKDFNQESTNFRYIRINNIELGTLTDRYIFFKVKELNELDNTKTDEEVKEYVIFNMMIDFQKNYYECLNIYRNYLLKYRNQEDKLRNPINYGVFFNIKKSEENNDYIINIFGLREYGEIKQIENFMKKIFFIFNNSNDKNVLKIASICKIISEKEIKNIPEVVNDLLKLNKKYRKCINNINEMKNASDYKVKKSIYDKQIKLLTTYKTKIVKKISEKEKITKHVKILKRLQDVFPNLRYKCGDKNIKQYTKSCQGRKQPMGTGSGIYEEVIDFNEKYEERRLKNLDDVTCDLDEQKGGNGNELGKYKYYDYCNYFNNVLKERKTYFECYKEITLKEAKGKKVIQKIASDIYGIDSNRKKIGYLLDNINQKIQKSKVNLSNYKIYLQQIKESNDIFLIKYYTSTIFDYSLNIKDNLNKLSIGIMKKIVSKNELFKYLIDEICVKNNKIVLKDFIDILDLNDLIVLMKEKKIRLKNFLIYIIIELLFNIKIEVSEYKKILKYIYPDKTYQEDFKIALDSMLNNFYENHLLLKTDTKFREMENKEEEVDETSLKELRKDVKDLIIKKDKNNHITDSVLNYKGKALTCPNYSDDNNPNKPLIGFLDISKFSNKDNLDDNEVRDLVCQPCCFVQKYDKERNDHIITKRYRKNMLFCKSKITWKNYLELIENENRIEGYIYSESLNIRNTFGILPKNLYTFFNNYISLMNVRLNKDYDNFLFKDYNNSNRILKGYGYVLRGYEQKNNVSLLIIADLLKMTKSKIITLIKTKLLNEPELFNILNEGSLKIRFQTVENYLDYLNGESLEIDWLVDILSHKNIVNKTGLNILMFKKLDDDDENSDIKIQKYKFINMIDYFDEDKETIFLYKYNSGEIEPIVLKNENSYNGIFSKSLNHFKKLKKYKIDINMYLNDFFTVINQWVKQSFKNNYITTKQMIEKMKIKTQLIDIFYKVNYVVDMENNLIPVLPSSMNIQTNYKLFNEEKDLQIYLKTLDETISYLGELSKKLSKENYLAEKLILDENKNNIIGLELRNNLIIPVKKIKYESGKKYMKISRISNKFLYFKINNTLYDTFVKEDIQFIKEDYDIEIYQTFLLEISNHLNKNKKDLESVMELQDDKDNLYKKFLEIFEKIFNYKEGELLNYRELENKNTNIRSTCEKQKDNLFCEDNKLTIPHNKKNLMFGLFIENFINNKDFQFKILNNKINKIIDLNKFQNNERHVFIKKDVDF